MIDMTERNDAIVRAIKRYNEDGGSDLYTNLYVLYMNGYDAGKREVKQQVAKAIAGFDDVIR
jgi:hypothetical protein